MADVYLQWDDNSDDELEFDVERKRAPIGQWNLIAKPPADTEIYLDDTPLAGNTYTYRVRATNLDGPSAYSNESEITIPETATTVMHDTFSGNDGDPIGALDPAAGRIPDTVQYLSNRWYANPVKGLENGEIINNAYRALFSVNQNVNYYDLPSADFTATVTILQIAGDFPSIQFRNAGTAGNNATWFFQVRDIDVRLREDGVTRASLGAATDDAGTMVVTTAGTLITCEWQDVTNGATGISYQSSLSGGQNSTVANVGVNAVRPGCIIDDILVQVPV